MSRHVLMQATYCHCNNKVHLTKLKSLFVPLAQCCRHYADKLQPKSSREQRSCTAAIGAAGHARQAGAQQECRAAAATFIGNLVSSCGLHALPIWQRPAPRYKAVSKHLCQQASFGEGRQATANPLLSDAQHACYHIYAHMVQAITGNSLFKVRSSDLAFRICRAVNRPKDE